MVADLDLSEDITEAIGRDLSEILGLDPGVQQCRIEAGYFGRANMQSEATISAYMRSGRVDMIIASKETFNRYAATGYLSALRDCGLEKLEDRYSAEELFYAKSVDYSKGQAITDIPCSPMKRHRMPDVMESICRVRRLAVMWQVLRWSQGSSQSVHELSAV